MYNLDGSPILSLFKILLQHKGNYKFCLSTPEVARRMAKYTCTINCHWLFLESLPIPDKACPKFLYVTATIHLKLLNIPQGPGQNWYSPDIYNPDTVISIVYNHTRNFTILTTYLYVYACFSSRTGSPVVGTCNAKISSY